MKTTLLLTAFALGLAAWPVSAQDLVLPSGPPRNAQERMLQDRVDAQIRANRARGIVSPGEVRREERFDRRDRYERRDRTERRWEREDRRRWERSERRRDRWDDRRGYDW